MIIKLSWFTCGMLLWTKCLCQPKSHLLNPNARCDGIMRCGLWEVIRSWEGALMNGISALMKAASPFLPYEGTATDGHLGTRKRPLTKHWIYQRLHLNLPACKTLFVRHSVYGIFVSQAERTKTQQTQYDKFQSASPVAQESCYNLCS